MPDVNPLGETAYERKREHDLLQATAKLTKFLFHQGNVLLRSPTLPIILSRPRNHIFVLLHYSPLQEVGYPLIFWVSTGSFVAPPGWTWTRDSRTQFCKERKEYRNGRWDGSGGVLISAGPHDEEGRCCKAVETNTAPRCENDLCRYMVRHFGARVLR